MAEGFKSLGHRVTWRNHGWFEDDDVFPDAGIVVTFGQRLWSAKIAETYRGMGVPVVTVDLPPLRMDGLEYDYRALWLNHVNWMPAHECPCDRLEELNLEFRSHREDGHGVLLCGQCADDAAHGMGAVELRDWAQRQADAIGEFDSVTWRPHPQNPLHLDGFGESNGTLAEALSRDWRAVATFNSTCGLVALLEGLPVFCDESAFYAEVANTSLARLQNPTWPDIGARIEFFCRLAYVQWTFDELASGEAVQFILREI